jgi:DNA-binding XRE family transcriptional regulator
MKRDLVNLNLKSSFQSVEKDIEIILRKLFVENKPLSDDLKKLLIINTKDCLDEVNASKYKILIDNMKLKDLREENGVTQTQIAEYLNVKQNTYSQYENEKRQLPIDVLVKLSKFYKVTTDYILGLED